MTRAVFLDRDGTLNHDSGYVHKVEELKLLDNVIEGLRLLKEFKLFLVTNQSGIGRGYYTEEQFHEFNDALVETLRKEGIKIEHTKYCPHHPEDDCVCRKPSLKFLHELEQAYGLDLKTSFVIGDHPHDIEMGHKAGCKTVYMLTGHGEKHKGELKHKPDFIANDFLEAAQWVLRN